jgi:uncharacterized protein
LNTPTVNQAPTVGEEPMVDEGLELLDEVQCRELLAGATLGRIGLSRKALPVIVPVNYGIFDGKIMFWSGPGTKLAAAQLSTIVAFEVDRFDEIARTGWSVLVVGVARVVRDMVALDSARRRGLRSWVDGDRSHLVQIDIEFISGRRIVPTRADAV